MIETEAGQPAGTGLCQSLDRARSLAEYTLGDRRTKHDDTSVSLFPLSFKEAIARLAQIPPKRKDSQAAESDSTKSPDAPKPARTKRRTAARRKPSGD